MKMSKQRELPNVADPTATILRGPNAPPDNRQYENGKRGKGYPPLKTAMGSDPHQYSAELGSQVLHECLGGWGGYGDDAADA
jgi:hypothetical protein